MENKLVWTSLRNTLEDSEMVFEIPREKERKNLPFGFWKFLFGHFFSQETDSAHKSISLGFSKAD